MRVIVTKYGFGVSSPIGWQESIEDAVSRTISMYFPYDEVGVGIEIQGHCSELFTADPSGICDEIKFLVGKDKIVVFPYKTGADISEFFLRIVTEEAAE